MITLQHLKTSLCARKKGSQKGFSLPELVVVIGIFVLITTVALFNQGQLSSNILITNLAYETALAVREAQVYGIGVRNAVNGDASESGFAGEFGAHFNIGSPTEIVLYANGSAGVSQSYEPGTGEEKFQYQFTNQRGNKIVALCVGQLAPGEPCTTATDGSAKAYPWVDIIFKRPNPAPFIMASPDSSGVGADYQSGRAYIVLNTIENSNCRVVIVEPTGQIRVEDGFGTGSSAGHCTNN